ncbi:MAG: hypothetical protein VCD00_02315 [Candidatus Hydrogenedentota bacterium]
MKKPTLSIAKVAYCTIWIVGLGMITGVLLVGKGQEGGFQHYLKLYCVTVLWVVFGVYAFNLRRPLNWKVLPSRWDRVIVIFVMGVFWIILLGVSLQALLNLQLFVAALLGFVCFGLFNVLRDLFNRYDERD